VSNLAGGYSDVVWLGPVLIGTAMVLAPLCPFEMLMKGVLWLEPFANALGPRTLASLKYLVEQGRPIPGKHGALPRAPVSC